MSLDSLLIRGLCLGVLLVALAFTQIDLRKRGTETSTTDEQTEIVASQSFDPTGSVVAR